MQSFRTELENPVVEKDIIELEKKIYLFKEGKLDEGSFRSLRLARGVYGQRQQGVQMVRIKLPLGIISAKQLNRIAEISDHYSNGKIHLTTRQDVQIHYVSLEDTPQLWSELEQDEITLREACGNTVRNITASSLAGVDLEEPFDVTPFGLVLFEFFLRNPVGQEMGRKFKIAFSSSERDTSQVYMHDLGFIPLIQNRQKGFKVVLGGGLGAQPNEAVLLRDFLPVEALVPFSEAVVKVFDQYGERSKRNKARLKFLLQQLGPDVIGKKIAEEYGNSTASWNVKPVSYPTEMQIQFPVEQVEDESTFNKWRKTNVIAQKQEDFVAILVKVRNGNLNTGQVRQLSEIVETYSQDKARITIEQNLLIRFIPKKYAANVYNRLKNIGLADFGANTIRDITACPGTDTCNLGITGTYNAAVEIENLLVARYEEIVLSGDIKIKMSGCMNACGQHSIADIGFHGSTIKQNGLVYPALQVLLGGVNLGNGKARFADKVIKVPAKRVKEVIRIILDDFLEKRTKNQRFSDYYETQGKIYFYDLLKEIADLSAASDDELLDWGATEKFKPEIGVGECAGVKIDLVKTLLFEAYEKVDEANYFLEESKWKDAAYSAYSAIVQTAKAFLIREGKQTNSKQQIEEAFEEFYPLVKSKFLFEDFNEFVSKNKSVADQSEVAAYVQEAERFHLAIDELLNANKS